jgi:ACT domain-containing protein
MSHRWLTAEDVRRASSSQSGGELVVDAGTVVTPQAMEVAEALGLTIRTSDGNYTEPAPDRGPDAVRASHTLSNLPEPGSGDLESTANGAVVTVVGRNRAGVLAEITRVLSEAGCNVHDISQRIIADYFHLILTVEFPPAGNFGELKQTLECMGGKDDYAVNVVHDRVFHFMHRI